MIYTVTLNPALDYFVELEQVNLGAVNRAMTDHKAPGGKGINVSKVLKRLGHQSEAFGFIGGFTGKYLREVIEQDGIATKFIEVTGDTRINVKIKGQEESEINGVSPRIKPEHLEQLRNQMSELKKGDILVLAGSVPATIPFDIYEALCREALEREVEVFIDSSGEPLSHVLQARPTFIKPNHHELGELFSTNIANPEEAVPYIEKLIGQGIKYVLVSFAGDGALLGTKDQLLFANTPKGKVKNSVGAGDSVVAGFIAAKNEKMALADAFRFAVATGSATAFSTTFAERAIVEELMKEIDIKDWRKGE
ncbi:1-phosphofructokinase [Halalkalibacter krulwichiae]|uniref:Tagatose-6-phosphate kinase n=1 Tax=Halalkalibacter krulwichiae TaxID=199441 RepID=A0A1X9M8G2_9BACI|nr:1-phosphofructokinase [Halalkalibacter krulwichiae]ARK28964.1 Tagatose-6-phosphate kinase [Halalkalibacter krulwichiae]